jgi:hypothetical protein
MLQTRSRLVAFRVSEEEYEDLRLASSAQGARSVSEFVRSCVTWIILNCDQRLGDLLFTPGQPVGRLRATGVATPAEEDSGERSRSGAAQNC